MAAPAVTLVMAKSAGGTGRHVHDLAHCLTASGADVTVAAPPEAHALFDFGGTGARVAAIDIAGGADVRTDLRAVRALRPLLRGCDVVHAHGLRAGAVAAAARAGRRVPLVVTWHNAIQATGPLGPVFAALERWVARRADVTLCVSGDLVRRVVELGGRDVRLAPVGAPRATGPRRPPDAVRAELGAADRPLVLGVGRLADQKGFDVLVRAAAGWREREPPPVVAIAGEGPCQGALAELSRALRAEVLLLGRRDDVGDLLAAATVVAMPSRWEGSPLAAHEAMRAGRPVVAFSVGGLPDMLGDGARLVPPGDEVGFAAAVAELLDDAVGAAELGERAIRQAAEWPDAAAAARRVVDVYEELRRGGGRPERAG